MKDGSIFLKQGLKKNEKKEAFEKLEKMGEYHLLSHWSKLNDQEREALINQILSIDLPLFLWQKKTLEKVTQQEDLGSPPKEVYFQGNDQDKERGKALIKEGKVGTLIVAGGQGTRLGSSHSKGLFPISLIKKKTLFQLFLEKTRASQKQAERPLFLAIMTSPLNDSEIRNYLVKNQFFGLQEEQISLFSQKTLPFLDCSGKAFLDLPYNIAEGPDGNGRCLKGFYESGIWNQWKEQGIDFVNFILIDNPLADPFDAELIGFHSRMKKEVIIKCVERKDFDEKVGILLEENGTIVVREYHEISDEKKRAQDVKGKPLYPLANLSLFSFSMNFIEKIGQISELAFPLHKALKPAKTITSTLPAWKFERYIFDVLPFTKESLPLCYPRELTFSPLKNAAGPSSPETVQRDLLERDLSVFKNITGKPVPEREFELSQEFHYPTQALLDKWRGKNLPDTDYIES